VGDFDAFSDLATRLNQSAKGLQERRQSFDPTKNKAQSDVALKQGELKNLKQQLSVEVIGSEKYQRTVKDIIKATQELGNAQKVAAQKQEEITQAFLESVSKGQPLKKFLEDLRIGYGDTEEGLTSYIAELEQLNKTLPAGNKFAPELKDELRTSRLEQARLQRPADPGFVSLGQFTGELRTIIFGQQKQSSQIIKTGVAKIFDDLGNQSLLVNLMEILNTKSLLNI
jgi:hypothetical protein